MELAALGRVLLPAEMRLGFHSTQLASVPRRLGAPGQISPALGRAGSQLPQDSV